MRPGSQVVAVSAAHPLNPSAQLLCKLGSIIVHADEFLSPFGHDFDRHALLSSLQDEDVQHWLRAMAALALVPLKRERP
jgi:hypothetical protein